EIAVVVVIAESRAGAPATGIAHAGFSSDVGERSIAIVVIEHGAVEISNVEIFPSVVVVVANRQAEAPSTVRDPGFGAYVGEGAVVIVAVELVGMALAGAHVFQGGAVDQEDVHPAVVVVIEDGDASAHGLNDVAFFQAPAGEMEIDAGGARDVGKGYGACGCGLVVRRFCWNCSTLCGGR